VASSLRELNLDPFGQQPQRIPIYRDEPEFVDRVRNNQNYPVINNPDGSVSTHRMAAESDANGNWYVFPTIQMQDGKLIEYYDSREAMDAAFKTGNILRAPNKQSALNYAEGAYKRDTGLGDRPVSTLRGLQELSPSDPLYIHQDPMPAGADIMTQQEAISELGNREMAASAAGTVSPFESSFNPTNPNFRATAQNAISNMLGGSNISSSDNYLGGRVANTLTSLLDFAPGLGDGMGIGDTMTSYRQGDMLGTGINALATGVGVLPLVGGPASKAVKAGANRVRSALRGIDAWHGSPYEFENFSMDKIGTGEGAQAYGDGIYFAEQRGIGEGYRERLSAGKKRTQIGNKLGMPDSYEGELFVNQLALNDGDISKTLSDLDGYAKSFRQDGDYQQYNTLTAFGDRVREAYPNGGKLNIEDDFGALYNVNLNVEPDELLDWDAPFSQQPEKVQKSLLETMKDRGFDDSQIQSFVDGDKSGEHFYNSISGIRGMEHGSDSLKSRGILGIRYLDGTSRSLPDFYISSPDTTVSGKWMVKDINNPNSQGSHFDTEMAAKSYLDEIQSKPTRNYVMFDDSLIDTKRVNDKLTDSWMNPEARMARADEMGFNRDIYHKTWGENFEGDNAFSSFDPQKMQQSDYGYAGKGVYATPKPLGGSTYGNVTMQLKTNIKNPYIRTADNFKDELDPYQWIPKNSERLGSNAEASAAWTEMMQSNGYDGFIDEAVENGEIVIFDPKNVRSINAEFDPTKADSSDLLSSISPTQSSLRNIA
jgi:hypothetical protein